MNTILYVIYNKEQIKEIKDPNLNSENILICLNPFNKENDITNTSKTYNNYNILFFDKNLIFKIIRLKKIKNIVIKNSYENYNLFVTELKSLNTFNSIIFYYELDDLNEDMLNTIKIFKKINFVIFKTKSLYLEVMRKYELTKTSKKYIINTDEKKFNYRKLKMEKINNELNFIKLNEIYVNMYNNDIDNKKLKEIYKNIDTMLRLMIKYKNILFICGDYPGNGGAATNCNKLQNFFNENNFNTYVLYYNFLTTKDKKYEETRKYKIVDMSKIPNELINLKFKPDLIILKSPLYNCNVKTLFNCPVWYFVGGIFKNNLNKYYVHLKDKEFNRCVNKNVIEQMEKVDKIFVNSGHTYSLLNKYYNFKSMYIFYTSLVEQFNTYLKKDLVWSTRPYKYAIIMSDFERKIKNAENMINRVLDTNVNRNNIILIGKNSDKYKKYGFICKDLMGYNRLQSYYKKTKYIIQDSYYESSSNVSIEGLFNGCILVNKVLEEERKYYIRMDYLNIKDRKVKTEMNNFINGLLIKSVNKRNDNNFKILYFVDLEYFIKKQSRVRFHAIYELINFPKIDVYFTGPGWSNYNLSKKLEENIKDLNIKFDFVIWYKPLNEINNIGRKSFDLIPYPKCIRYNEMWDTKWTQREINVSRSNLIICHHENDYLKYKNEIYKNDRGTDKVFVYNPHHANPKIFYDQDKNKDIDILISGVIKPKHYPLKKRLYDVIMKNKDTKLKKYNIYHHKRPPYSHDKGFTDCDLIKYSELINRSKICIVCTSKWKYRLGKYVEIPMCGSLMLGDLPFEESDEISNFIIEADMNTSEDLIIENIIYHLENPDIIKKKGEVAKKWATNYTTQKYCERLLESMKSYVNNKYEKIFIISDEIPLNHPEFKNQKWICDVLKEEFQENMKSLVTNNPKEADIIWYLAPWNLRYYPKCFKNKKEWFKYLKEKRVIATIHHIDEDKKKVGEYKRIFNFLKDYVNFYHTICKKTKESLLKLNHNKVIFNYPLWINNEDFFEIKEKELLREKYELPKEKYIVGSFQKDTEGKKYWKCINCNTYNRDEDTNKCENCNKYNSKKLLEFYPKLSKGPDLFVKIILDMKKTKDVYVVLTGLRRDYLIQEFKKYKIEYKYLPMVTLSEINELYNTLNLYLVSSRVEGGPRSIFEASLTKTPIISTDVGVASELLSKECIYDMNNYLTYKNAKSNIEQSYNNVDKLTIKNGHITNFYNEFLKFSSYKKKKIFINFRPEDVAYGGGNIFTYNLVNYMKKNNICIEYNLNASIEIFLIIDPFQGKYKKYGLVDVINFKKKYNLKSKIVIRVNDCDITRKDVKPENSREMCIYRNYKYINYLIFNSDFIKEYYLEKYPVLKNIQHSVIYNGGNPDIFYPLKDKVVKNTDTIKIVTHHWSDNINKGYDIYYKLWKYSKRKHSGIEFKFIGRKFNEKYKNEDVPISGPYKGKELADELRKCDVYITASINDSCPNHVTEGLLCGLPILYINHKGGGKNLCELIKKDKIGEKFENFVELINNIHIIRKHYNSYRQNIINNKDIYYNNLCFNNYLELFQSLI